MPAAALVALAATTNHCLIRFDRAICILLGIIGLSQLIRLFV